MLLLNTKHSHTQFWIALKSINTASSQRTRVKMACMATPRSKREWMRSPSRMSCYAQFGQIWSFPSLKQPWARLNFCRERFVKRLRIRELRLRREIGEITVHLCPTQVSPPLQPTCHLLSPRLVDGTPNWLTVKAPICLMLMTTKILK